MNDIQTVSIRDIGFSRACTVFTACLFVKYVGFLIEEHFARLFDHCRRANIPTEELPSSIEIAEMIKREIYKSGHEDKASMVRIYVVRGESADARTPCEKPRVIVDVLDFMPPSTKPVNLETLDWIRLIPEVKMTAGYGEVMSKDSERSARGFDDFVFTTRDGKITESTTANIFFVEEHTLWTPGENMMQGTTRSVVLNLVRESGLFSSIDETSGVPLKMLPRFKECFITSTSRGVTPVACINRNKFKVGEDTTTSKLQKMFFDYRNNYFKERGVEFPTFA